MVDENKEEQKVPTLEQTLYKINYTLMNQNTLLEELIKAIKEKK